MRKYTSFEEMKNIDLKTVSKDDLVDVTGITFDINIPMEQRAAEILKKVHNPFCYRVGPMAVKLEYPGEGPSFEELFMSFLIRKKSGLHSKIQM